MVVWKFPFTLTSYPSVYMPIGAKILTVQAQLGVPCIWAEVHPEVGGEDLRRFQVAGTGEPLSEEPRKYIGSWQAEPAYVWHLFELLP